MAEKHVIQLRRGRKDSTRDDWAEYEKQPGHIKPQGGELVLEYDNGIPRLKIGDGEHEFSALSYMSIDSFIIGKTAGKKVVVNLLAASWGEAVDSEGLPIDKTWSQVVLQGNENITEKSKVDLQPDAMQLAIFHEKDLTFVAKNRGSVVTVYCVGQKPANDYQMQATVTELEGEYTEIVGNTTATPTPQPDWNQTDETKADYIKNKPEVMSAYDIACQEGFEGTEAEWLASLKGEQGQQGEQGTGVTILGSYDTEEELNEKHPTGNIGDSYLVDGNLYVWDDINKVWNNVGNIKGEKGNDGKTPVRGVDYYTDSDKTEMVNAVLAALPKWNEEVDIEDESI